MTVTGASVVFKTETFNILIKFRSNQTISDKNSVAYSMVKKSASLRSFKSNLSFDTMNSITALKRA